jgi:16S rRNA C967 or C1407 C5-methylase (RsmB/RsmF family)
MENKGIIVANEMIGSRIAALGVNCMRCGTQNVVITQQDARKIKHGDFTKILLDAPCSGTGTIRKSPRTINEWNPSVITKLAHHNLGLLVHAWSLLAPGGTLVYSTCTLEPEENEGVISAFLSSTPDAKMQPITLSIKRSAALTSFGKETYHPDVTHCLRIYPQDNDTEGFFVAKLCKQA